MAQTSIFATWIAVDWGTTNLRAWAMSHDGQVLANLSSDAGMSKLSPDAFEPTLLDFTTPWLRQEKTEIIACGMVGSRQGWTEAPYRAVPTNATGGLTRVTCKDPRIAVSILAGIKQAKPADVMRGEETQIAGYLRENPQFDGVICLPGTHSKWAHISAGEIVSFQTFMTGEMFEAISKQTVLRHSVSTNEWDADAFNHAVSDSLARPEALAARLFNLRASELLDQTPKSTLRSRLSGLLIGAELAAARPYWLGQNIALIGTPKLTDLYAHALELQGQTATQHAGEDMVLGGLIAAYREVTSCPET